MESNRSINYPNPPDNTPYTRSEVKLNQLRHSHGAVLTDMLQIGELPLVDSDVLLAKLGQMVTVTPPSSTDEVKGERDFGQMSSASRENLQASTFGLVSSEQPRLTYAPTVAVCDDANDTHDLATPTPDHHTENDYFGDGPVFPEASAWEGFAEEDVEKGLQRLAMLAKDLHKVDNTKTAEQHYSERLSKILKGAEFKFDASKLK